MDIGFIGSGNMGGAIIQGYAKSKHNDVIHIFDKDTDKAKQLESLPKIIAESSINDITQKSDIIVLAVKPNIFHIVLPEIKETLDNLPKTDNPKTFVSIAAGISINYIKKILGENTRVIRTMPNLNAMVGQGMTAVSRDDRTDDDAFSAVIDIFSSVGKAAEVEEELIDTVIGVSGSSPAYAFMYINALAKCAEKNGMDKENALAFAAQATLGAAVTVMESGIDPETLTENVCSPGGTTIEAVNKLKNLDFESVIEEAMTAAMDKSKQMTK